MFLKFLVTVVLAVVAWITVTRIAGWGKSRASVRGKGRKPIADDLVKCAGCGIYLPAGQACDCTKGA